MKNRALFVALSASIVLSACNGGLAGSVGPSPGAGSQTVRKAASSSPIQHVIIIMQQGRSFDNLFYKYPGANFANEGRGPGGKTYRLQATPLAYRRVLLSSHYQFDEDYDKRKNDGWENQIDGHKNSPKCDNSRWVNDPSCYKFAIQRTPYSYVEHSDIEQYWTMAQRYVLGDDTFASNSGPAFPSLQYMIAGESGHASEDPDAPLWGCPDPQESVYYLGSGKGEQIGPDPCFPLPQSGAYPTLAGELDAAGVSWRYYVESQRNDGVWLNAYAAVSAVYNGPDWKSDISYPNTNVLTDISKGNLAQVSWVMPSVKESDRSGPQSGDRGPEWVTSIVNAVGESQYWKNTAIVVLWSDWGGWYDHVLPPQYPDPQTGVPEGLGYRVPLIVISAYAKKGYITHVQHEIASTTHFIEVIFGLAPLGSNSGGTYADQRADALGDCFQFGYRPRTFKPIGK